MRIEENRTNFAAVEIELQRLGFERQFASDLAETWGKLSDEQANWYLEQYIRAQERTVETLKALDELHKESRLEPPVEDVVRLIDQKTLKVSDTRTRRAKADHSNVESRRSQAIQGLQERIVRRGGGLSAVREEVAQSYMALTLLEAQELKAFLMEEYGIEPAAGGAVMLAGRTADEAAAAEEKIEFDVVLKSAGSSKINVIKEVRAVTGLGLKEAKDLVEAGGRILKEQVSKAEADEIKAKLEAAGAEVELNTKSQANWSSRSQEQ